MNIFKRMKCAIFHNRGLFSLYTLDIFSTEDRNILERISEYERPSQFVFLCSTCGNTNIPRTVKKFHKIIKYIKEIDQQFSNVKELSQQVYSGLISKKPVAIRGSLSLPVSQGGEMTFPIEEEGSLSLPQDSEQT